MALCVGRQGPRRSHPNACRRPERSADRGGWDRRGRTVPEDLRRAAGAGVRQAAGLAESARLSVAPVAGRHRTGASSSRGRGRAARHLPVHPDQFRARVQDGIDALTVLHPVRGKSTDLAAEAAAVARAVLICREWVNIPANLLYPDSFADEVAAGRGTRVTWRCWTSRRWPRRLRRSAGGRRRLLPGHRGWSGSSYRPRGAKFHLALVGKGITFDSGGLTQADRRHVHDEVRHGGGAAVLGAMHAIASESFPSTSSASRWWRTSSAARPSSWGTC